MTGFGQDDDVPEFEPELTRGAGTALWRQIEATLVEEIGNGVYREDAQFPTEQALAQRFAVNRHTVRRAVAGLVQRGLIRVEQGRGAFLIEHAIDYAVGPRTRFSENLMRQGRWPGLRLVRLAEVPASGEIARQLKLPLGAPTVLAETVGFADGIPVSRGLHYFPAERLPGIAAALEGTTSISRALAQVGVSDYRRSSTRITARLPTPEEVQHLRVAPSQPVLVTENLNVDSDGAPVEYGLSGFAADRMQLVVES